MKETRKNNYEAPSTQWMRVELEQNFMKASVISKDDKDKVQTSGHEMGNTHDAKDWQDGEWK